MEYQLSRQSELSYLDAIVWIVAIGDAYESGPNTSATDMAHGEMHRLIQFGCRFRVTQ